MKMALKVVKIVNPGIDVKVDQVNVFCVPRVPFAKDVLTLKVVVLVDTAVIRVSSMKPLVVYNAALDDFNP